MAVFMTVQETGSST